MKLKKRILAGTLTMMSFLPVVSAVKSGGKGYSNYSVGVKGQFYQYESTAQVPEIWKSSYARDALVYSPFKRSLPDLGDHGFIRRLVYRLYSLKGVKNGIYADLKTKNSKVKALRDLFEIIEGRKVYDNAVIASAYSKLDSEGKTLKYNTDSLNKFFCKVVSKYLKSSAVLDVVVQESEPLFDFNGYLLRNGFENSEESLIFNVYRKNLFGMCVRSLSGLALCNFYELTDKSGNKYELSYFSSLSKEEPYESEALVHYIKQDDGNWYKYGHGYVQKVAVLEVVSKSACSGFDFIYNKKA